MVQSSVQLNSTVRGELSAGSSRKHCAAWPQAQWRYLHFVLPLSTIRWRWGLSTGLPENLLQVEKYAVVIVTFLVFTGGRLHGFHAQLKRTRPGEGCQAEGGALREACGEWGGGVGWGGNALWPLSLAKGPFSTDSGDSTTSAKGYFFYTVVTPFVIIPEYLLSDQPLETRVFHGCSDGKKIHRRGKKEKVFLFLPNHCDWICEKLHPILYLCNTAPCLALQGFVWLSDHHGGGPVVGISI